MVQWFRLCASTEGQGVGGAWVLSLVGEWPKNNNNKIYIVYSRIK